MKPPENPSAAKIISRETVFDGYHKVEIVTLQPRSLRHAGWAEPMVRDVMHCGTFSTAVLYIPETDEMVLSEQFRQGAWLAGAEDPFLLECAAGGIDGGETPEDAVIRETLEETGCVVVDMELIGSFFTSPGCLAELGYFFCARVERPLSTGIFGLAEEGEEIKTHLLPALSVIKMLDDGKIQNGPSALALHWFARNRDRLRAKWLAAT